MVDTLIRTLPEQIAQRLRQDIMTGKLKPSHPLREQEISDRFGVSRGPIREVFRQLTQQGLLVTEANKGVRVASQPSAAIRPLIINLRLKIEWFALDSVFEKINEEQIEVWEKILENIKTACERSDTGALVVYDLNFHQAILSAYEDDEIVNLWQPIVLRMLIDYQRLGDLMESYYEHKAILDAIRAGDKPAALAALQANIK